MMVEEIVSSLPLSDSNQGERCHSPGDDPTNSSTRCDLRFKNFATALAVTTGLLFNVSTADAKKPLDVDCDLLEATNDDVNDFLDIEGVQFDNLGDLVSSSIQDENVFDQLSSLILLFSGGQIDFTSASQAVTTNARCGLIPQLIGNIRD
jgi:hypothetical protein